MVKYYIYEPGYCETLDFAIEFDYFIETYGDEEEALQEYLKGEDNNGNFVDGYPDGSFKYVVYNSDTLTQKEFEVGTDWEPQFYLNETT